MISKIRATEGRTYLINSSPMFAKYNQSIDRESAYELLQTKLEAKLEAERIQEEQKQLEKERKALEKQRLAEEKEKERAKRNNPLNKVARSTMTSITGTIGRSIARGILGSVKKIF